jgi:hypothetical protein
VIVVVNYANHPSQCRLRLPFSNLRDRKWRFQDLLGKGAYDWDGAELETRGLYLDMTPWQSHAFDIQSI